MLGSSLGTLQALVDDNSSTFDSENGGAGKGHGAVWFDRMSRSLTCLEP